MIYRASMRPHPWKVPFRQVYASTFWGWVKAAIRIHARIRRRCAAIPESTS